MRSDRNPRSTRHASRLTGELLATFAPTFDAIFASPFANLPMMFAVAGAIALYERSRQ